MLCDEDVLNYVAPDGKLIKQRCVKKVLESKGFYEYLLNRYSDNTLDKSDEKLYIRETLFRMMNKIEVPPVCKICGTPVKFSYQKYPNYCSRSCSNHDEEVLKKISSSCSKSLKKAYEERGDEIKNKRISTLSEKYNVEIDSPTPFAIKEIQKQAQDIVFEKYGVKNSFQLDWVKQKSISTQRQKSIDLQKERGIDFEYLEDGRYLVKDCCPIHGDLIYTQIEFNNRFRPSRFKISNPCYICNPFGNHVSGMQQNIFEFIKSIYDGEIIENNKTILDGLEIDIYLPELKLGFEFNGDYWHMNPLKHRYDDLNPSNKMCAYDKWKEDRHKILLAEEKGIKLIHVWEYYFLNYKEQQLDFISNIIKNNLEYINPIVKLKRELDKIDSNYVLKDEMIFEYEHVQIIYLDGFYFNKESIDKKYLELLMSKTKRNIFVYDYEIIDDRKFEVILSDIRYALHKLTNKISARKCDIRVITNKESKEFLNENSLFGYRSASIVLGLFYNDELVMVYSFGNNYYGRKKDTEVIRVCTKKNIHIVGGSSKCLKYYIDNFAKPNETIIFYVDSIHHDGSSLKNEGFEHVKHEYGLMNYYITFDRLGEAFNRNPNRHKEIKDLIDKKEIVEVITNGVDVYKKVI